MLSNLTRNSHPDPLGALPLPSGIAHFAEPEGISLDSPLSLVPCFGTSSTPCFDFLGCKFNFSELLQLP